MEPCPERKEAVEPATILVIDDQEPVRRLLQQALEDAGYQVFEAANGRQGLELFLARPTDLVITDIAMPEMNGLDLILALTKAFLDIKVIAMTGACSEELQKAKLLGARQTFQKPLDLQALLRAVEYELRH
jgi:DNA-binding NtrC family response regulator